MRSCYQIVKSTFGGLVSQLENVKPQYPYQYVILAHMHGHIKTHTWKLKKENILNAAAGGRPRTKCIIHLYLQVFSEYKCMCWLFMMHFI